MAKFISYTCISLQLFLLFVLNFIAFKDSGNHTGFNLYIFGFVQLAGVVLVLFLSSKKMIFISIAIASITFVEVKFLEKCNIAMTYEKWLEKGKPDKWE